MVSLDTFLGCYIHLPKDAIVHALLAVDDGILDDYYLGSYLSHLDDYFHYQKRERGHHPRLGWW